MSTKYKIGDEVPVGVLCDRLRELSNAVTEGKVAIGREFYMRIPAEVDHDADLILHEAARRLSRGDDIINDVPENMPLVLDSGLWALWDEDMLAMVLQQGTNETFSSFIKRCVGQQVDEWVRVDDRLPEDDSRVDCKYDGVYKLRANILFWFDVDGVTPHFGGHAEPDGKGSQPATHWRLST